jgi:hypothetical protein
MKKFEFLLNSDSGEYYLTVTAQNYGAAEKIVLDSEKCPKRSIRSWRVVPTAKQIKKTKSLMRGL